MINIRPVSFPMFHRISPNKDLKGWKKGELKDVLIAKYKCGRFAVMGNFVVNLFASEDELHETFTEQLTIL